MLIKNAFCSCSESFYKKRNLRTVRVKVSLTLKSSNDGVPGIGGGGTLVLWYDEGTLAFDPAVVDIYKFVEISSAVHSPMLYRARLHLVKGMTVARCWRRRLRID